MPDSKKPEDGNRQKQGGFGAFADKYRDRWAANHPNAKPPDGAAPSNPADSQGDGAVTPEPMSPTKEDRQTGGGASEHGPGR